MSLFSERSYVSGFGRLDDNYNTYLYLIKHVLLCVSGTYWSWFFVRKAARYVESHIHRFFVPPILRYIGTLGSAFINTYYTKTNLLYTNKEDRNFIHLLKSNRALHADKLNDAVFILYKWTQLADVIKLESLSIAENFSSTDDVFSRKIILELFSTHRLTRLNTLLHYLNDSVPNFYESQELAGALSTLIVMTVGFPEHFYINSSSSKFRFIDSIMVDALRASQDSYVFDFVLNYIITPSDVEATTFFQELLVDEHVKYTLVSDKYRTPIINAFSKPSFMLNTAPGIKNGLFGYRLRRHAISFFQNIICSFYNTEYKDVYVNFFEAHIREVLTEIKKIHFLLQRDSNNNYVFTKQDLLSAGIISSIDDEKTTDFEKYHLIFAAPITDDNAYHAMTFKKSIQDHREHYALIRSSIERVQASVNVELYIKTCTHATTTQCFDQLQNAYKNLLSKFKQYQGHLFQHEKAFASYQVVQFLGAFKFEIESVIRNKSKVNTWCGDNRIKNALKRFFACDSVAMDNAYHDRDTTYNIMKSEYTTSVTQRRTKW
ncbi:uncharacterized protein EV154DRAFT_558231 [Mucor mucedo]|uniref:uncharacterized protein n=1 Tax=Mucor mucedo TaxID=29922 RepID=UPI0022200E9D|nr:uncharacterized protein EV154DRAFT_558231 [Mucor mucedo]KAI7896616.1 hypothetical protein EV154DRAFT_558231 [Mucor mucedo]